jgi:hypothetical protein
VKRHELAEYNNCIKGPLAGFSGKRKVKIAGSSFKYSRSNQFRHNIS